MQNFHKFQDGDYVSDAPSQLNGNFDSVMTDFKGSSFPTENLAAGMTCFRSDENIVYRLREDSSNKLVWVKEYELITDGIKVALAERLPESQYATQEEAEAGTDNTKPMTPLRVKQSVQKNAPAPDVMTGASVSASGKSGLVPEPKAGDNNKVLHGDGSWKKAVGFDSYWEAKESVKTGDVRFLQGRENSGYILECVTDGVTGDVQPVILDTELIANYTNLGVVGRMRIIFNIAEKDVDEVLAMGVIYSRLTYPELWNYAQARAGLIVTEEEWQAKFAETNGKFVPYYSSGDGSSTFRTPLLGAYAKGAENAGDVGEYKEAGLPNVEGRIITKNNTERGFEAAFDSEGAFKTFPTGASGYVPQVVSSYPKHYIDFDASRSNPIYGNSDTVTPETMTGIWVIKAVGIVVDSGETDIAQVLQGVEETQNRISVVEDSTVGISDYIVESYRSGTEWYEVWKSGKVRQGGQVRYSAIRDKHQQVTLLKNLKDSDYVPTINPLSAPRGSETWVFGVGTALVTTSSFLAHIYGSSTSDVSIGFEWQAEGQGA